MEMIRRTSKLPVPTIQTVYGPPSFDYNVVSSNFPDTVLFNSALGIQAACSDLTYATLIAFIHFTKNGVQNLPLAGLMPTNLGIGATGPYTLTICLMQTDWNINTLTFNTKPAFKGPQYRSFGAGMVGAQHNFTLFIPNPSIYFGLAMKIDSGAASTNAIMT